jgi:hypothetical protein
MRKYEKKKATKKETATKDESGRRRGRRQN